MMKTQQQLHRNHPGLWRQPKTPWGGAPFNCTSSRPSLRELAVELKQLSQNPGWLLFINPPGADWTQTLRAAGIDLRRVLQIRTDDEFEAQWALEQAMAEGNCAAALAWLPELDCRDQRRLQLVSRKAQCPAYVIQPDAPVWSIPSRRAKH